MNSVKS